MPGEGRGGGRRAMAEGAAEGAGEEVRACAGREERGRLEVGRAGEGA